ncbi:hypothetical protein Pmani_021011 [Petrolisthes manimaculis]|uniref:Uncharacterized protein n=1 Tax=Petrolisthes manimaculis TaxID=1843537 RepID=A0AAE1PGF6_9EUCA|nr:hypothetical protein Pmani_021011 [Petrolisthes manimaculis]
MSKRRSGFVFEYRQDQLCMTAKSTVRRQHFCSKSLEISQERVCQRKRARLDSVSFYFEVNWDWLSGVDCRLFGVEFDSRVWNWLVRKKEMLNGWSCLVEEDLVESYFNEIS